MEADDEPECAEDNYPLAVLKMARELFDCEFKDLLAIDDYFQCFKNLILFQLFFLRDSIKLS